MIRQREAVRSNDDEEESGLTPKVVGKVALYSVVQCILGLGTFVGAEIATPAPNGSWVFGLFFLTSQAVTALFVYSFFRKKRKK